jgi:hypothetical protein
MLLLLETNYLLNPGIPKLSHNRKKNKQTNKKRRRRRKEQNITPLTYTKQNYAIVCVNVEYIGCNARKDSNFEINFRANGLASFSFVHLKTSTFCIC